ncbi:hypothetical protein [Riemerella columbipharyngis]|uniref:Uncharacterized protein n=1 Tax=Riemerella columbipharyngis TaxID=1071918 RepID=A0A1G7DHP9_9FLAO|nr:hypothetical protein [Riemerella columbipharyngis]SDE50580.1 hypothetical protein SAMN05421544_11112 [Riemerella columbipharyngis]
MEPLKNYRKESMEAVIGNAFRYWYKTIFFQLIFSLIYSIMLFIFISTAIKMLGLEETFHKFTLAVTKNSNPEAIAKKLERLLESQEVQYLMFFIIFIKALLYPLNIGFFRIYNNMDLGIRPRVSDLFEGFRGNNFPIFFGYYLFWIVVSSLISYVNLGFVWVFFTFLISPILFFQKCGIIKAFKVNIQFLKIDFPMVLVGVLISLLFSYCGLLFFGIGLLLTFPFWNAMIYAVYKNMN